MRTIGFGGAGMALRRAGNRRPTDQPSGAKNCSLRRQVVATGNELSFPANHDRTWLPPPVRPS
jgi:hypothetical protein